MKTTPKLLRPTDRAAVRASTFASAPAMNSRAAFPAAMGNRAFIRAWAARRAKIAAIAASPGRV